MVKLWIRALRAPFFQAVIIPTALGAAIAWYQDGIFHVGYFLLTVLGVIFVNAGTNLSNDYFDHKSGNDDNNDVFTAFSGGSRVIQDGLISAKTIHTVALISFGLAATIGVYFTFTRGWPILIIGLFGAISGYLYTATPTKFVYRGWGELIAGLNCGPLVVLGAYYVQVQHFSIEVVVASIPIGFLAAAILYINQFSDYKPDKEANKNTLIVILGPKRAVKGYFLLMAAVYLVIIIGSISHTMPMWSLISLITIPLAWKAAKILQRNYDGGDKMIPAMASNIATHLTVGLLLSLSYVIAGIMV